MRDVHRLPFVGVVLLLSSTAIFGQPVRSTALNFVVRAGEYHGTIYVPQPTPPATFLIFNREELSLSLAVGNPTDTDRSLTMSSAGPALAFKVRPIRIPAGGTVPSLAVNPVASLSARGLASTLDWAGTMELPSRGSFVWTGTLLFAAKPTPGIYELQITPTFGESDGSVLNPLGTLVRYEVRDVVSHEDRVELARRRMMHEFVTNADIDTETAADALLRLYPQSALAYQIKGEMARRQGRLPQAVQSVQRAIELLTSGQDVLYISHVPAHEVDRILENFRGALRLLQRRQP